MANTTNLTQALFRIDPTEGLVEYVQAIKPYHTKILETLVEYVYTDVVKAQVVEDWSWVLQLTRPDADIVYSCGYGYRWSPSGIISPEATPTVKIIKASGSDDTPANTFLVTPALYPPLYVSETPFDCLVINTQVNQLAFTTPYNIVGVNSATRTWTISGSLSLSAGDIIYVNSNGNVNADGKYIVAFNTIPGITTDIIAVEDIYPLATGNGTVNVPVVFDDIPYWPSGVKVQLASTGTLPTPLSSSTTYYFIPTATTGVFNLSIKRYPQQITDFIDLTSFGQGILTIVRTEPFIPGQSVTVQGSYVSSNDGTYIITTVEPEGLNFRIGVVQKVNNTTPIFVTPYDGIMVNNIEGYDDPSYCAVASAPDLFVGAYIHETLQFTFELSLQDLVGTQIIEDQDPPSAGFGESPFDSQYDFSSSISYPFTVIANDETLMVLPTGFDTQFFDVGGLDETLSSISKNYGHIV